MGCLPIDALAFAFGCVQSSVQLRKDAQFIGLRRYRTFRISTASGALLALAIVAIAMHGSLIAAEDASDKPRLVSDDEPSREESSGSENPDRLSAFPVDAARVQRASLDLVGFYYGGNFTMVELPSDIALGAVRSGDGRTDAAATDEEEMPFGDGEIDGLADMKIAAHLLLSYDPFQVEAFKNSRREEAIFYGVPADNRLAWSDRIQTKSQFTTRPTFPTPTNERALRVERFRQRIVTRYNVDMNSLDGSRIELDFDPLDSVVMEDLRGQLKEARQKATNGVSADPAAATGTPKNPAPSSKVGIDSPPPDAPSRSINSVGDDTPVSSPGHQSVVQVDSSRSTASSPASSSDALPVLPEPMRSAHAAPVAAADHRDRDQQVADAIAYPPPGDDQDSADAGASDDLDDATTVVDADSVTDDTDDSYDPTLEPDSAPILSFEFEIFGKVQGVSFRAYTAEQAQSLGLVGYVQNTLRGTVIGKAQGPPALLQIL